VTLLGDQKYTRSFGRETSKEETKWYSNTEIDLKEIGRAGGDCSKWWETEDRAVHTGEGGC
jgi:hypothetical protein